MSISHMMPNGWRRFLAPFARNHGPTPLEDVSDAYRAELDLVARCAQHAQRVHYPQFRVKLLRIAAEVQAHLPWLQEQILALGGSLPPPLPLPSTLEGNSWKCFRRDVEEVRRSCGHLLEWIHRTERETPAIATGLQRIRTDKLRHREEFREILMKSDPYTNSTTGPPQAHEARQKQAWHDADRTYA